MTFIEVNKRILDYAQYREDVQVFIALLLEDFEQYTKTLGMSKLEVTRKSYHKHKFVFFHSYLDLEVAVHVKKKEKPKFV